MEKTLLKECTQEVREETSSAVDTLKKSECEKNYFSHNQKRPHSNDKNNKLNIIQNLVLINFF